MFDCVYELDGDTFKLGFINGPRPPTKIAVGPDLTLYAMTRDTSAK